MGGLTVVLANAESPIVNGYFCLATEALDDDGLPHTLEHLIFLGSEDYPYKEVLDLLANRCLADRTNAWTDTDHTCYTVYTAGLPKNTPPQLKFPCQDHPVSCTSCLSTSTTSSTQLF